MVSMGIRRFHLVLEEGIPERSAVVLQGPAGDEKDLVSYQFLAEGLRHGEGAFIVLSRISPDDFREEISKLGLNLEMYEERGEFFIVDWYSHRSSRIDGVEEDGSVIRSSESMVNLEIAISEVVGKLDTFERKRGVVDVLSPAMKIFGETEIYEFSQTLRTKFRDEEITSLFVVEKGMHKEDELSSLHQAFDGVIDIIREEAEGRRETKIGTLFMRGVRTEAEYVPLAYEDGVIVVKSPPEVTEPITVPEEEVPEESLRVVDEKTVFVEGMRLLEAGQYEEAVEKFNIVTEIDPDYREAWNAKANALMHLGRNEEATRSFKKALEKVLEFVDRDRLRELTKKLSPKEALREIVKEEIGLEMAKCPICGTRVSGSLQICPDCGATLGEEAEDAFIEEALPAERISREEAELRDWLKEQREKTMEIVDLRKELAREAKRPIQAPEREGLVNGLCREGAISRGLTNGLQARGRTNGVVMA